MRMQAREVQNRLRAARDYTLSSADIGRLVREKRAKGLARRSAVQQKADLTMALEAAREAGDEAAAAKYAPMQLDTPAISKQRSGIRAGGRQGRGDKRRSHAASYVCLLRWWWCSRRTRRRRTSAL